MGLSQEALRVRLQPRRHCTAREQAEGDREDCEGADCRAESAWVPSHASPWCEWRHLHCESDDWLFLLCPEHAESHREQYQHEFQRDERQQCFWREQDGWWTEAALSLDALEAPLLAQYLQRSLSAKVAEDRQGDRHHESGHEVSPQLWCPLADFEAVCQLRLADESGQHDAVVAD